MVGVAPSVFPAAALPLRTRVTAWRAEQSDVVAGLP